jgi:membrane protein implicated in regulation of membrane protease activity
MIAWLAGWWNWPFLLSFLVGMGLVSVSLLGFAKDAGDGHAIGKDFSKDAGGFHALEWLGAGKAPLSLLLYVLLLSFGLLGLLVNAIAHDLLAWGGLAFPVAFGTAAVGSILSTRGAASLLERIAPAEQITARRSGEFVGQHGVTASLVTKSIGQVRVEPPGALPPAILNAAVDDTWPEDIPRGAEVLLVAYDEPRGLYRIRPLVTD